VRAIVFDAAGTLIHPEPPAALVYHEVGRRYGCTASSAEIASRYIAAFRRQEAIDRQLDFETSEARERQRWSQIVSETLFDTSDWTACLELLYAHFARPAAWQIVDGTIPTVTALAERGIVLAVASNFDGRLRELMTGFPALAPIGRNFISSEIGWRKPARPFFETVSCGLGETKDRILYVGDDLVNDYQAATAAGMRSLLFDPNGRCPGVPSVRTFADLLAT
jgi:putative hydrolase of the HAD superfamily